MHRIIKDNGIFIFTTHGKRYDENLSGKKIQELNSNGFLTIEYEKKGHRMMSTYNRCDDFKKLVDPYFLVLEYYDGAEHPNKVGGQYLWIVKKKERANPVTQPELTVTS